MYARRDIPTVLPDAVLRCRKLQAAANVELDEMEKTKFRRINNLEWQQQTFQKTITERHKRWRVYDRAFRLKLKRELGADLSAALRLRTMQDEEEKMMFEQQLIEQSFPKQKKDHVKHDEKQSETSTDILIEHAVKSNSAHPDSKQDKVSTNKRSQSAVNARNVSSASTKKSHPTSAIYQAPKLSSRRPRTSRFDPQTRRDTDPSIGLKNDFGSVLLRILSNIAATPDLDDDFTIRKRALETRERRLIGCRDERFFNLIDQLAPSKILGKKDTDNSTVEDNEQT